LKNPKPNHKFFERFLNNDLSVLFKYLNQKQEDILLSKIAGIPKDLAETYNKENGPSTQLGNYYNIFNFDSKEIKALKEALKDATVEASEYYGIDFEKENYHIHGWFNLDFESPENREDGVSPIKHSEHYHDHMGGTGAPFFHGYYCVNAEPSITYYKINNQETIFENINKNNRAIISETGHPHGRDDWYEQKPRITIAYDIAPGRVSDTWVKL